MMTEQERAEKARKIIATGVVQRIELLDNIVRPGEMLAAGCWDMDYAADCYRLRPRLARLSEFDPPISEMPQRAADLARAMGPRS